VPQRLGREPDFGQTNGGFRTIFSHTTDNKSITESSNLPYATDYFKGAEIAIRTNRDLFNYETVVSHTAKTVVVTATNANTGLNTIRDKFGYIFQNHINTLNLDGEWFHDIANETLYLYSSTNPNSRNVEVPVNTTALTINNSNYVKINGLRLENASYVTLSGQADGNISIDNCHINNSSLYGTNVFNIINSSFTNNTITQTHDVAMRWEACSGVTVSGNTVRNAGLWAGMGTEDFIGYTGLRLIGSVTGAINIIENNTIDSIGYHGLNYGGGRAIVRRNNVQNFCMVKDDGGGIYTVNNDKATAIYENIVHDAPGATLGAPLNEQVKSAGIYTDNDSKNQDVYNNSIYNIGNWGILVNLSSNNSYRSNTIFNCGNTAIALNTIPNSWNYVSLYNNVKSNVLFPRLATQNCADFTNTVTPSDLSRNLGTLDSNYYCQPYEDGREILLKGSNVNNYVLGIFQSLYPTYEANGKSAPIQLVPTADPNTSIRFEVNPTATPKMVNLGTTKYVDAKGRNYQGNITIAPYSSLPLIKGEVVDVKDIAAGIQYKIYPNPTALDSPLNLSITLDSPQPLNVQIYTLQGVKVYERRAVLLNNGANLLMLSDFKASTSGVYLLYLNVGKRVITQKITIF
jgi:hypothetical protein